MLIKLIQFTKETTSELRPPFASPKSGGYNNSEVPLHEKAVCYYRYVLLYFIHVHKS